MKRCELKAPARNGAWLLKVTAFLAAPQLHGPKQIKEKDVESKSKTCLFSLNVTFKV